MSFLVLILLYLIVFVLLFILFNLKWLVKEIREICDNEMGYIKLIQLLFIILVFSSFFILLLYYLVNNEQTSKLDIFVTVVVGLLGTIVGTFFSEKAMDTLKKDRDLKRRVIIAKKKKLMEYDKAIKNIIKQLNKKSN